MTRQPRPDTVAVLHCGDLGAAVATLLRDAGHRVVTTCEGRSDRTRSRAEAAGVEVLPTLSEVVRTSGVVISLVDPGVAAEVAGRYASVATDGPPGRVYVDANSIGLDDLATVEARLRGSGSAFVDATIHGGASRLRELGAVYLSGPQAGLVASLFESRLRVRVLGEQPGQATRMKLLLAGTSKSLNMLFLEMAVMAERSGALSAFLEEYALFYPGLHAAVERMLPTYPEHAQRRVLELEAVVRLGDSTGAPAEMARAAAARLRRLAPAWRDGPASDSPTVPEIVQRAASVSGRSDQE